jgi:hypothetical protein
MSDNENKAVNAAPVLTAQDRKKRILERRRQSLLQRSQSMPTNLLGSSPSKRSRLESFSRRSSRSSTSSVKSQLFPDDSRVDSQSTLQTRLFSSDSQTDLATELDVAQSVALAPHGTDRSSLFGRVMQQSQNTPKVTRTRSDPTTPTQRMAKQLSSPGGFGLVKMLSSVMSPFAGKSKVPPEKIEPNGEWEEASLDQILDWTIKAKVRLECHPPSCLPNTISEGLDDWTKALQYWQYSTDDSSKSSDKPEGTLEPIKLSKASETDSSSALLAKRLVSAVSGPNAFIHQLLRSDEDLVMLRARRRWQSAFQSLYQMWIHKIEQGDMNAYFYATTCNQVILFRSAIVCKEVTPMVVFSSTTKEMRSNLQSRGVTLHLLRASHIHETFDESLFESKKFGHVQELTSSNLMKEDESLVETDLEAIRRAQAFGETAGADVNVKATSKRQRQGEVPPLYIFGYDDCGAFATILLNQVHELEPRLISRMGTFQNSTMKSLVVTRQRTNEENAFIEILGPILPCAIPAFVRATAATMQHHAATEDPIHDDDSGLGSHFFVVQTQPRNSNEFLRDQKNGMLVSLNWNSHRSHRSSVVGGDVGRVDAVVWDICRPCGITYKLETD